MLYNLTQFDTGRRQDDKTVALSVFCPHDLLTYVVRRTERVLMYKNYKLYWLLFNKQK